MQNNKRSIGMMKKRILALGIFLIVSHVVSGCGSTQQMSPTVESTQAPTKTSTPEPSPTETLSPTLTPTVVPTMSFFSIDPTIVATAESCDNSLAAPYCVSGLTIELTGRKLSKYKVDVTSPGFPGTASFDCPQRALIVSFGDNVAPVICDSDQITFVTVGLAELTLTISWEGDSMTKTLAPNFEIFAPQGLECSPQCSTGKAEINIP
jgi:hypothetical protein